jgi:hypothetical protein
VPRPAQPGLPGKPQYSDVKEICPMPVKLMSAIGKITASILFKAPYDEAQGTRTTKIKRKKDKTGNLECIIVIYL